MSVKFSESGDPFRQWRIAIEKTAAPPHHIVGDLEAVLQTAFMLTQVKTHVLTGSLKASGKTDTDFDGDEWVGTISYGGALWKTPSPGPANNPVDYAIYEMARGGDHDFFGPLVAFEGMMEEVLLDHWSKK